MALQMWLDSLLSKPDDLYRYKGILAVQVLPGEPVVRWVIQGVHDMMESDQGGNWPADQKLKSQLVVIGKNLDSLAFTSSFAKLPDVTPQELQNYRDAAMKKMLANMI